MTGGIREIFSAHALTAVGACPFSAVADRLLPCRAAARLPKEARTVLCALFPYRVDSDCPRNLSRYAGVPDYHIAAGGVLEECAAALRERYPACAFEPFIDNSPLPEVYVAACAGLGCVGDNGLLIHPTYGSWVFIGCIVTDLDIGAAAAPVIGCTHCGACAAACPAGCIGSGREECLSRLTQTKGELTAVQRQRLLQNGLVWGCDTCQEVCPLNRGTTAAPHPCFTFYEPWLTEAGIADLSGRAYGWRGPQVLRRNMEIVYECQEEKE